LLQITQKLYAMKKLLFLISFLFVYQLNAQDSWEDVKDAGKGSLQVAYLTEYPYAFTEHGSLVGIEIEILKTFQGWVNKRKEVELSLNFVPYKSFSAFYEAVLDEENSVGSGSVTITKDREKEVVFSPEYLRNVTVLVTRSGVQTLSSYNEIPEVFEGMTAIVREGTTHEEELKKIKAFYNNDMVVKYVDTKEEMKALLDNDSSHYYAMIDLITCWRWMTRDKVDLKIHRIATVKNESFGFVFNQNSDWKPLFDEFFTSGFGFTSTEEYVHILNRYLGPEIIEDVKSK